MSAVTAFIGVSLFTTIGVLLVLSVGFIGKAKVPSTVSAMVKNPRFIAGCVCLVLAVVCSSALI